MLGKDSPSKPEMVNLEINANLSFIRQQQVNTKKNEQNRVQVQRSETPVRNCTNGPNRMENRLGPGKTVLIKNNANYVLAFLFCIHSIWLTLFYKKKNVAFLALHFSKASYMHIIHRKNRTDFIILYVIFLMVVHEQMQNTKTFVSKITF